MPDVQFQFPRRSHVRSQIRLMVCRCTTRTTHGPSKKRSIVTIDGRAYELEQLSDQARQQLDMVLACDTELRALEQELVLAQTARNAYAGALKVAFTAATGV
jgi:hypothetical protein